MFTPLNNADLTLLLDVFHSISVYPLDSVHFSMLWKSTSRDMTPRYETEIGDSLQSLFSVVQQFRGKQGSFSTEQQPCQCGEAPSSQIKELPWTHQQIPATNFITVQQTCECFVKHYLCEACFKLIFTVYWNEWKPTDCTVGQQICFWAGQQANRAKKWKTTGMVLIMSNL